MSRPVVAPFVLKCISELGDVMWLVMPCLDTSPGDVPRKPNWKQVWGLRWPWESRDSAKLQVTLDNVYDGLILCRLEK